MSQSEDCCEDALMGPIISLAKFRPQGPDPERGAVAAACARDAAPGSSRLDPGAVRTVLEGQTGLKGRLSR